MTDLFREIEEDIRRDQLNKLWEKYGIYLVGLAVGIVLVAAAIVGWRAWERSKSAAASATYSELVTKAEGEKPAEAAAAFGEFAEHAPSGYAALARLRQAGLLVDAGDTKGAVAVYDTLAARSSAPDVFRDMARVKAALLLLDQSTYDDMKARLGSVDVAGNAWRNNAREILGLAAWKAGKYAEAGAYFDAIVGDSEASAGLRDRAHVMQAVIAPHLPRPAAKSETKPEEAKPAAAGAKAETSNAAPAEAAANPKAE